MTEIIKATPIIGVYSVVYCALKSEIVPTLTVNNTSNSLYTFLSCVPWEPPALGMLICPGSLFSIHRIVIVIKSLAIVWKLLC